MHWLPIDSAPKDGREILVCMARDVGGKPLQKKEFGLFVQRVAWWTNEGADGEWVCYCSLPSEPRCFFSPTHWMPIPDPPNE